VRMKEDRRSVDIIAVMHKDEGIAALVMSEVDHIASLLGKGFNSPNNRVPLCPMCCSADMFVRLGAAHAFHMQELDGGEVLQCSRYHVVTVADVMRGKLTVMDMDSLPLVYPSRIRELQLPWKRVAEGGIIKSRHMLRQLQPGDAAWEQDNLRVTCPGPGCGTSFNVFNRRHHCRYTTLLLAKQNLVA
jgi:hypothetical protein